MNLRIYSFLLLLVIIALLLSQDSKRYNNTKWIAPVTDKYSDYIIFQNDTSFVSYDCELDEKFNGYYFINQDTLIIKEEKRQYMPDNPWHSITKLLISGDKLIPFYNTYMLENGRWSKPFINFDKDYYFSQDTSFNK